MGIVVVILSCSSMDDILEEEVKATECSGVLGFCFHPDSPFPPKPSVSGVKFLLPLFTHFVTLPCCGCLFNPFQLLIPLKSQEDLDRAVEHLDLSPSLKSLRVFVKAPRKANVSHLALFFCLQSESRCYCIGGNGKEKRCPRGVCS